MTPHVYFMGAAVRGRVIEIDFSIPENAQYEWLTVGQMLDGDIPLNPDFIRGIDIYISTERPLPDAIPFNARLLISKRFRESLESLELSGWSAIQLLVRGLEYYILEVENIVDCLDEQNSCFRRFPSTKRIMAVTKYAFRKEIILPRAIFRIPQNPSRNFVTEECRTHLLNCGLKGVRFVDYESPPEGELLS